MIAVITGGKTMKNKELIEYLQTFDGDKNVGILILNMDADIMYHVNAYDLVKDDVDYPIIIVNTDKVEPLQKYREDE